MKCERDIKPGRGATTDPEQFKVRKYRNAATTAGNAIACSACELLTGSRLIDSWRSSSTVAFATSSMSGFLRSAVLPAHIRSTFLPR
jgi:hypothetical protein